MYSKFKIVKIDGGNFTVQYTGTRNIDGEFVFNTETKEYIIVRLASGDETGCDLRFLLRKSKFYEVINKLKNKKQIDNNIYVIACG